jgi:RNA polymerase sigma-B factor
MTQAEIAEQVGVSQVHVSRILRATLAKLGDDLDPTDLVGVHDAEV